MDSARIQCILNPRAVHLDLSFVSDAQRSDFFQREGLYSVSLKTMWAGGMNSMENGRTAHRTPFSSTVQDMLPEACDLEG